MNLMLNKTYIVKVDGIEIPMDIDKLIANAGRGVMAARNKNYDSRYKTQAKRFEAIKDITDEEIVAIRDARGGDTKAYEYLGKSFIPNVDEDTVYAPAKLPTTIEEYDFITKGKTDGSYQEYEKVINGFGAPLYNELTAIADSSQKERALSGLYDDVQSGAFNKIIGSAMSISDSGGVTQLEAYVKAANDLGDTNQANTPEQYAHQPDIAIQPSEVHKTTYAPSRVAEQPTTVPNAMTDHQAQVEQMKRQFG